MKRRNQNRPTSLACLGLPGSEVHVDLRGRWTGHKSHAGSFVEVRVGSCCSYCAKMAHEVTLRALLAIFGGWSETQSRVGTVDLDGYKIRESAHLTVLGLLHLFTQHLLTELRVFSLSEWLLIKYVMTVHTIFSDNQVTVQYCQLVLITFRHMQVPPKHWFQQEVNCW